MRSDEHRRQLEAAENQVRIDMEKYEEFKESREEIKKIWLEKLRSESEMQAKMTGV